MCSQVTFGTVANPSRFDDGWDCFSAACIQHISIPHWESFNSTQLAIFSRFTPGGVMVRVLARNTKGRGFDSRSFHFQLTTLGKLFHTHVPLLPSSITCTGQAAVMPCGWEGNRRSGVALAMRHRLQWFTHLRSHGLDREMSTPTTLS